MATNNIRTTVTTGGPYDALELTVYAHRGAGTRFAGVRLGNGLEIVGTNAERDDEPDGAPELRKLAAALLDAADRLDELATITEAEVVPA